jgi:hypothetical protein
MRPSALLGGFLLALVACHGEEGELRARLAGEYVRELRPERAPGRAERSARMTSGPRTPNYPRQTTVETSRRYVLTLREDGRWTSSWTSQPPSRRFDTSDSGTFRIQENQLILRALTPTDEPIRYYWIGRDTLHEVSTLAGQTEPWIGPERLGIDDRPMTWFVVRAR